MASEEDIPSWALKAAASPEVQAAIYRFAAVGALTAFVGLAIAGSFEPREDQQFAFEERAYYAVVAQVLPVLFLTFAVERRFFDVSRARATSIGALLAFAFVVLNAAIAELLALTVIGLPDPPHDLKEWATLCSATGMSGALVLVVGQATVDSGMLALIMAVIADPERHFNREKAFGKGVLYLLGAILIVGTTLGHYMRDTYNARRLVAILAGLLVIALWLRLSISGGRILARGIRKILGRATNHS